MLNRIFGMAMLLFISANAYALEFLLPVRCEGTRTDKIKKTVEEHTYLIQQRTDSHWGPVVALIQIDGKSDEEGAVASFSEEFDIKVDQESSLILKDGYGSWFSHLNPFGMQSTSELTLKDNGTGKFKHIYWAYDDSTKSNREIKLRNCHAY